MKKFFSLLLATTCTIAAANAESFSVGDMTFVTTSENTVELNIYSATEGDVKIPATVENAGTTYTVTSIGSEVFLNSNITSIEMPETIIKIGNNAFQFCKSLKSVVLSDNLEYIGSKAFATCRNLSAINWPHSLKYIGSNAFLYDSTYDGEIYLPGGITIDEGAFTGMFALTSVTIDGQPTQICAGSFSECSDLSSLNINCLYPPTFNPQDVFVDDWGDFITENITLYVPEGASSNYLDNSSWGNCFASIKEKPFTNTDITKPNEGGGNKDDREYETFTDNWSEDGTEAILNVPEAGSLADILGEHGHDLIDLRLSGSLNGDDIACLRELAGVSISGEPIKDARLKNLDLFNCEIVEGGNPYFSYIDVNYTSNDVVGNNMFGYAMALESIILPKYAKAIGKEALSNCLNLKTVKIGDFIESIGELAFNGAQHITEISLPTSCTYIDDMAFYGCRSLETVIIPGNISKIGFATFYFCTSLSNITLPSTVKNIDTMAFFQCTSLHEIDIPASVSVISTDAFGFCTSLTRFNVSSDNTTFADIDGVLFDKSLSKLIKYPLGKPDAEYTVPSGTLNISQLAFDGASIEKVTIPEGVQKISDGAFADCISLTEAELPTSLSMIENHAFYNNNRLQQITINATTPPTCLYDETETPFTGVDTSSCKLIVPEGCENEYANAEVWKDFSKINAGILSPESDSKYIIARYGIDGHIVTEIYKGIQIVKYSDGTTTKIAIK